MLSLGSGRGINSSSTMLEPATEPAPLDFDLIFFDFFPRDKTSLKSIFFKVA